MAHRRVLGVLVVALAALAAALLASTLRWLDVMDARAHAPPATTTTTREWRRVDEAPREGDAARWGDWGFPGLPDATPELEGRWRRAGASDANLTVISEYDETFFPRRNTSAVSLDGRTELECVFDPVTKGAELQLRQSRDRREVQFRCRLPMRADGPMRATGELTVRAHTVDPTGRVDPVTSAWLDRTWGAAGVAGPLVLLALAQALLALRAPRRAVTAAALPPPYRSAAGTPPSTRRAWWSALQRAALAVSVIGAAGALSLLWYGRGEVERMEQQREVARFAASSAPLFPVSFPRVVER